MHRSIAEHCPVPVFVADYRGQWIEVNDPMVRLLGAARAAQLTGKQWLRLLLPAKQSAEYARLFTDRPASGRIQLKFRTQDNRHVVSFASLVRLEDAYLGFLVPCCEHPKECPIHHFLLRNIT
jgi:PAS domain S-box-containing protein